MNTEEWALVAQAATAVISLCGPVAVVISLQQVNRSLKANAIAKIYEEIHQVHHVLLDYPQLRPIFFHNASISQNDPAYLRCRGIAEMFLDIFERVYQLRDQAFKEKDENWKRYIAHMCDSSAFLCEYVNESLTLIDPPQLRKLVAERINVRNTQRQAQAKTAAD